jgi:hypothetical protein
MIPCACKHSIARAMSNASPTAIQDSRLLGRRLTKYLRKDPPTSSSVTTTMAGSRQAPINCATRKHSSHTKKHFEPPSNKRTKRFNKRTTLTRFLCCTLDSMVTSLKNLPSLLVISSGVSPLCTILMATFWFLYLPISA